MKKKNHKKLKQIMSKRARTYMSHLLTCTNKYYALKSIILAPAELIHDVTNLRLLVIITQGK